MKWKMIEKEEKNTIFNEKWIIQWKMMKNNSNKNDGLMATNI